MNARQQPLSDRIEHLLCLGVGIPSGYEGNRSRAGHHRVEWLHFNAVAFQRFLLALAHILDFGWRSQVGRELLKYAHHSPQLT